MIAPLGDLHIGGVRSGKPHPGRVVVGDVGSATGDLDQGILSFLVEETIEEGAGSLDLIKTHKSIDLGKLVHKICRIALGETTSDDELLTGLGPVKTAAMRFQNGTDALLLGRIDESAGIDEHDIRFIRLGCQLIAMPLGISKKDFGIDQVLGATKAYKTDFA
jgi:hypothetical protein